jgi:hypothetical protein
VNHEPFKNVAEGIQAVVTSVALIAGGIWALWRFVLTRVRGSAVFDGDAVGKIEGIVSVKGWAKLSAWPPVNG